MADYHTFIDTVKFEKANAVARYQRFKKLTKLLQLLQILTLLAIVSWSSTRIPDAVETVKLSGRYIAEISLYVLNPHVIFLIGNAIVLTLYVHSRHIDVGNVSAASDFYEDYEKRDIQLPIAAAEPPSTEEMIDGEEETQIVCNENLNLISETESVIVEKAPTPAPPPPPPPPPSPALLNKETKQLERTMSVKVKPAKKKEFRRSETEVRRVLVTTCRRRDLGTFETVDTLSNEEFRLTVEAFIKKQQKFLRQQRMAEIEY